MTRATASRIVNARGGCERCTKIWEGANTLAVAARHHDRTQHRTWVEETRRTEYGTGGAGKTDQPRMI